MVIVRFDAPLFFANGGMFDDYVRHDGREAGPGDPPVVLAAEPITDVDTTAVDELIELDDHLDREGHPRCCFAEMKGPVKDRLIRLGLGERLRRRPLLPDGRAPRSTSSPTPFATTSDLTATKESSPTSPTSPTPFADGRRPNAADGAQKVVD